MQKTKVKVSRVKLIEAIKSRRKEAEATHKASKEKAKAEAETYAMRTIDVLQKAIDAVEKGKTLNFSTWGKTTAKQHRVSVPDVPSTTSGAFDGSRYDRDIKILEMSEEDTISISAEDFERYVR